MVLTNVFFWHREMAELGNHLFQWVLISFCVFSFVWILCLKYLRSYRLWVSEKLNGKYCKSKPVIIKVPTIPTTEARYVFYVLKHFRYNNLFLEQLINVNKLL